MFMSLESGSLPLIQLAVQSAFQLLVPNLVLAMIILFGCVRKRSRMETLTPGDDTPVNDATTATTIGGFTEKSSSRAKSTSSSLREKQEDHTGDTYKEIRPSSDYKNMLSVVHLDRTDTIVPAGLSESEQKILLKAMSKGAKRTTTNSTENKSPSIDKVITFSTSDEITFIESSDTISVPDDLELENVVTLDPLLIRLIQNGPRQFHFEFDELQELLTKGTEVFQAESSLLEVDVPCVIYGDIHGQYSDLHRWFNLNGWPNRTRTVFLGDFVDRGSHGVEVIALLSLLKIHFPDRIYIVRGNHEEESLNKAYSFYEEVLYRFSEDGDKQKGQAMYASFKKLFMHLPLAVLVGKRILGMHGGISPKMTSFQEIRNIKRPIDDFEVGSLECDLVWSDPDTTPDTRGFRPNLEREPTNGIGQLFSQSCVKEACENLGVDLMIRGHQAPLYGYAFFAEGKMMTLFSAPGYKGTTEKDINMGACVEVSSDMQLTIKQLRVSQKFRRARIMDTEKSKILYKKLNKN